MTTNYEQPKCLMEQFEQENDLNRAVINAMRKNSKTAPLIHIWDYLKDEQIKRTEWLKEECDE